MRGYIVRMPKKMKPEAIAQTFEIFEEYKQGRYSLRKLARKWNLPFSTLRDRFKSIFGDEYTDYSSNEGTTFNLLKDILSGLHGKEHTEVEKWIDANFERLLSLSVEDNKKGVMLMSEKKINSMTLATSRNPTENNPFYGSNQYAPYIEEDGERIYLHERY